MRPGMHDNNRRSFSIRPRAGQALVAAACALWLGGAAFGAWRLWSFESTPGAVGMTPLTWPRESAIKPETGRATLLMFVHPECSCTHASIAELENILSSSHGRIGARIVMTQVNGLKPDATAELGARLTGTPIVNDALGLESRRYGALTSGYTVVYDADGALRFSGGITSARGHAGDNMGHRAAVAALLQPSIRHATHEVYGCPLTEAKLAMTLADNGHGP